MIIASAVRALLTAFAWVTAVSAGTVHLTPRLRPSPSATRSTAARPETGSVADGRPSWRAGECVAAALATAGWLVGPTVPNGYRDPILAQETNKDEVDYYQSHHSLGRGAENAASASDVDKYYDDTETPAARAWKLKVGRAEASVPRDDGDEQTRTVINVSRTN